MPKKKSPPNKQYLVIADAADIADVSGATITNWCKRYGIGHKVGWQWRVDPEKLDQFLRGEYEANQ